jgi:hypothetical protein
LTAITPIEIRNLTKTFGAVRALDGLELTVREGEVHGFLGTQRRRKVDDDPHTAGRGEGRLGHGAPARR